MRAVVVTEYGGPGGSAAGGYRRTPCRPRPTSASGCTPRRSTPPMSLLRIGDIDDALRASTLSPPYRPGMEVAGFVDEIGPDTHTDVSVGDRVMAIMMPIDDSGGAYAEYVVVDADQVTAAPAGSSHAEAATLPMNGLTARRALDVLNLTPGETLAVTGAAGAVGGYVVQLAKADGLRVIADAAPADEPLITELGADEIVARGAAVGERIRQLHPEGVAAVVDAALQGDEVLPALRDGGQIAIVRRPGERGTSTLHPEPRHHDPRRVGARLHPRDRQARRPPRAGRAGQDHPARRADLPRRRCRSSTPRPRKGRRPRPPRPHLRLEWRPS